MPSSNSSNTGLSDSPPKPGTSSPTDELKFPAPPSPMEKVRTKLAVWSWAREQGLDAADGRPKWLPLLDVDSQPTSRSRASRSSRTDDQPVVPHNSQHHSAAVSARHSESDGGSPVLSVQGSPKREAANVHVSDEDDDEYPLLELKTRSSSYGHSSPHIRHPNHDYLATTVKQSRSTPTTPTEPQVALPRQLSNLALEETHFKTHRNSLDLLQRRQQDEAKINHNLMNSRDSIILARSKFEERYPTATLDVRPAWSRADQMMRISDASPPDERREIGALALCRLGTVPGQDGSRTLVRVERRSSEGGHLSLQDKVSEVPHWLKLN